MKSFLNIMGNIFVAALSILLLACNREDEFLSTENNSMKTVFFSTEIETKTVFGTQSGSTVPTLWTDDDKVAVSLNYGAVVQSSAIEINNNGLSAGFTVSLPDDGSHDYRFFAFSPYASFVQYKVTKVRKPKPEGEFDWTNAILEIPSLQIPLEHSVDERAQVLVAYHDAGSVFPDNASFHFRHVTAYGKLTLTNLDLSEGEVVTTVSLTAPKPWVGQISYAWEDSEGLPVENGFVNSIVKGEKTITLQTDRTNDIWFACAPQNLGGESLKITVTTTAGLSYSKTVSIPADKKFESGTISSFSVNMDGVTGEDDAPLTKEYVPLTSRNAVFSDFNPSSGALRVKLLDPGISIKTGSVFVYTEDSFASIRRVISVTETNDGYLLETVGGTLGDIFHKATFTLSTTSLETKADAVSRHLSYTKEDSVVLWEDGGNELSVDYDFDTSLDMELSFTFDANKGKGYVSEFSAKLIGQSRFDYGIAMRGKKSVTYENETTIKEGLFKKGAWFFPYGVPLYISFSTDLMADYSFEMTGSYEITMGGGFDADFIYGMNWSRLSGLSSMLEKAKVERTYKDPSFSGTLDLTSKISVFPRFKVLLYNLAGPTLDIKPYLQTEVHGSTEIDIASMKVEDIALTFEESAGVDGNLGLQLASIGMGSAEEEPVSISRSLVSGRPLFQSPCNLTFPTTPLPEDDYYDSTTKEWVIPIYGSGNGFVLTPVPTPVIVREWGSEQIKVFFSKNGHVHVPVSDDCALTATLNPYSFTHATDRPTARVFFNKQATRKALESFYSGLGKPAGWGGWGIKMNMMKWDGITPGPSRVVGDGFYYSIFDSKADEVGLAVGANANDNNFFHFFTNLERVSGKNPSITNCPYVKNIVLEKHLFSGTAYFSNCSDLKWFAIERGHLSSLVISDCPELVEVCILSGYSNDDSLEEVVISNCPKIKKVSGIYPDKVKIQ